MWSGFNGYVAILKMLLAASDIDVNKKSNVSDFNMELARSKNNLFVCCDRVAGQL